MFTRKFTVSSQTQDALAYDAIEIFAETMRGMEDVESRSYDCETEDKWPYGGEILSRLIKDTKNRSSLTGPLSFDEYGNRVDYSLQVVNLQNNNVNEIAVWNSNEPLSLNITVSEEGGPSLPNLNGAKLNVSSRSTSKRMEVARE